MLQFIEKKWSEKGQGIVEYALILAFVVGIAFIALQSDSGIAQSVKNIFSTTQTQLNDMGGNSGGSNGGGENNGG